MKPILLPIFLTVCLGCASAIAAESPRPRGTSIAADDSPIALLWNAHHSIIREKPDFLSNPAELRLAADSDLPTPQASNPLWILPFLRINDRDPSWDFHLDCWLYRGAIRGSHAFDSVAEYTGYGRPARDYPCLRALWKSALARHAPVKALTLIYEGASPEAKDIVLKKLRTRVGQPYSQKDAHADLQMLRQIRNVDIARIIANFGTDGDIPGESVESGIQVTVFLHIVGTNNFNIGYEF